MENNITSPTQQHIEEAVNLRDYFQKCLSKWYVFLLTVIAALICAYLYLEIKPPVYQSKACLLIKQDRRTGSSGLETSNASFSNMGSLFSQQTNVYNEIIAFRSPVMMADVVRRLDLRANYTTKHRLSEQTLFGDTLPVSISMTDFPDNGSMGLTIAYQDKENVVLSDMYYVNAGEKIKCEDEMICHIGDVVNTPVGKLTVIPGMNFYECDGFEPIKVTYIPLQSAVMQYSGCLNVELTDEDATAITLTQTDRNLKRSTEILDNLIDVYNIKWIYDRNQIAVSTSNFINDRLVVIEKELGAVDSDISTFKSQNKILDTHSAGNMYMSKVNEIENQTITLENRLSMAGYVREYIMNFSPVSGNLLPANTGMESVGIESQIAEYNKRQLERNNILANSSIDNPLVVDMDKSLALMRQSILGAVDNYIVSIKRQIASMEKLASRSNQQITINPKQAEYLTDIERKQKVKESLYLFLLQKREENELSQAFAAYNTRILNPPVGATSPVSPQRNKILMLALLLGFAIPAAFYYLLELTNTKIRGRKDLAGLSAPYIGEIPFAASSKKKTRKGKVGDLRKNLVVSSKNRNIINESFRVARANLEFLCSKEKSPVIMFTSYNVGSGKTFICANMAASLAVKGLKVCMVDLDIRKCSLSRYVSFPPKGITSYLSEKVDNIEDIMLLHPMIENLDVIPAGFIPPNPTELLYSERLPKLFEYLKERYDYIFLDCPPVEIVADSSIIGNYVDHTMFVVRVNYLRRDMVPEIENYYRQQKLKGMMLLLNGTNIEGRYSYNHYGQVYGRIHSYGNAYSEVYTRIEDLEKKK